MGRLTIVYWTVYSGANQRKHQSWKLLVTGLCPGYWPVTGESPAQMASNAEKVSILWCHHINVVTVDDDFSGVISLWIIISSVWKLICENLISWNSKYHKIISQHQYVCSVKSRLWNLIVNFCDFANIFTQGNMICWEFDHVEYFPITTAFDINTADWWMNRVDVVVLFILEMITFEISTKVSELWSMICVLLPHDVMRLKRNFNEKFKKGRLHLSGASYTKQD